MKYAISKWSVFDLLFTSLNKTLLVEIGLLPPLSSFSFSLLVSSHSLSVSFLSMSSHTLCSLTFCIWRLDDQQQYLCNVLMVDNEWRMTRANGGYFLTLADNASKKARFLNFKFLYNYLTKMEHFHSKFWKDIHSRN